MKKQIFALLLILSLVIINGCIKKNDITNNSSFIVSSNTSSLLSSQELIPSISSSSAITDISSQSISSISSVSKEDITSSEASQIYSSAINTEISSQNSISITRFDILNQKLNTVVSCGMNEQQTYYSYIKRNVMYMWYGNWISVLEFDMQSEEYNIIKTQKTISIIGYKNVPFEVNNGLILIYSHMESKYVESVIKIFKEIS